MKRKRNYELPDICWYRELDDLRSQISEVGEPYASVTEEENGKSYYTYHLVSKDFGDWIHSNNAYFKCYLLENGFGEDEVEILTADIDEDSLEDYFDNGSELYTLELKYKMIKKN